jgi:hypothetical protein
VSRLASFAILGVVVAGCMRPASPAAMTWVAVVGPRDSEAPEDLVLEIDDAAWHGYGGVVSVSKSSEARVRLVGLPSCRTYAQFTAAPGSMSVIRFAPDGTVRIEDWTARGVDAGPGLGERPPSGCATT